MRRLLMVPLVLLALAACQQRERAAGKSDQPAAAPAVTGSATSVPSMIPTPVPGQAMARKVSESSTFAQFAYAYPAAASAIPALRAFLDADIAKQRVALAAGVKAARDEASANDLTFRGHARNTEWRVVTEIPGWLSLSADHDSYEGGAHPNHWFDALLWDKTARKRRESSELFTSKQALSQAIRKDFCTSLNNQRAEKRGAPVNPGSGEMFSDCIDPLGEVVILGSSDRKQFNRIGILVAPYDAGPYAEGDYEVTLPVTDAVLAAVKPEFRGSFAVMR